MDNAISELEPYSWKTRLPLGHGMEFMIWFLICLHNQVDRVRKEKDGHADDRTTDPCDSFHNAVSLPRRDNGAAQNVGKICFPRRKENSAASGRKACPLRCFVFAYLVMSAVHFLQRQRKVTICALVQSASGLNVVLVVPLVMSSLTAHRTASA